MVVRSEPWPQGSPAWTDLTVSDLPRSQAFYTGLFGWSFTGGGEEYGGYCNAVLDGRAVAGISPPMPGGEGGEAPHTWTVYLAADDAQAVHQTVTAVGGSAVLEPMQVGPFGTMAVYADPTGAVFGTWQSGEHSGWQLWQENNAVCWAEAMVGDFESGKQFYARAFGYTYTDMSAEGTPYATFRPRGAAEDMGGIGVPEGQPPHWLVTFAVEDADATAARATDSGGSVVMEPFDMEYGRYAVLAGPDGEPFGVLQAAPDM